MGWAIGRDYQRRRHIGYGVPATCDHPGCGTAIDRGIAYACGGGVTGRVDNCGLFFCGRHLSYPPSPQGHATEALCIRCRTGAAPFDPSPDVLEWAHHVLTDDSWAQWRTDEPAWVLDMRAIVEAVIPGA